MCARGVGVSAHVCTRGCLHVRCFIGAGAWIWVPQVCAVNSDTPPPQPSALPSGTGWAGSLRRAGHQPPGGSRWLGRGLLWWLNPQPQDLRGLCAAGRVHSEPGPGGQLKALSAPLHLPRPPSGLCPLPLAEGFWKAKDSVSGMFIVGWVGTRWSHGGLGEGTQLTWSPGVLAPGPLGAQLAWPLLALPQPGLCLSFLGALCSCLSPLFSVLSLVRILS